MAKNRVLVVLLLVGGFWRPEKAAGQVARSWRDAVGEPRASVVEALCRVLFPGATIQWGQHLTLQQSGSGPVDLGLPAYWQAPIADGWHGVTGVSVGSGKMDALKRAARFESVPAQKFGTEILAFHVQRDHRVDAFKRLTLDPQDEVATEVIDLAVKDWPEGRWPVVELTYRTYYSEPESVGALTWNQRIDFSSVSDAISLAGRFPVAILKRAKGGQQVEDYLVVKSVEGTQVELQGTISGRVVKYSCGQPCVLDGKTIFDSW